MASQDSSTLVRLHEKVDELLKLDSSCYDNLDRWSNCLGIPRTFSNSLTKTVQHEFDRKIERVRFDLRTSEELLKAQLKDREAEIAALRSGALTTLASRQAALDKRRLEALDQLWNSVIAIAPLRGVAAQMAIIKFESAASASKDDPRVRELFESIGGGVDLKSIDLSGAAKVRPFVTPMVWAIYSAIQGILLHANLRRRVLTSGIGPGDFLNDQGVADLIVTELPGWAGYFKENGASCYYYALDSLDSRLLEELNTMMAGKGTDQASIKHAAEIMQMVQSVQRTEEKAHN